MAKLRLGRPKCYSLHLGILPLTVVALVFFGYGFPSHRSQELGNSEAGTRMAYAQPKVLTPSRKDVLVLTPWLAPIIWEGTFNIDILNEQFRLRNTTVGLTVFAIKKYVVFLKLFLETAEQHFMVGHKVTYYVFTDRPSDVPQVPLGAGRKLVVLTVRSYTRWQDVSMHRMEMISHFSEERFLHEVDYLILGKWYIHYWVGNMPIPENIKASPLPPFTFVRNIIGQLEFRMNISSPNECVVFKQVLDYNEERPGSYYGWSRHYFQIYLLEREDVSVIQYLDKLREFNHNMMMLTDRSRVKDPRSLRQFETLTAFIGLNITDIIKPSYDDSCELSRQS